MTTHDELVDRILAGAQATPQDGSSGAAEVSSLSDESPDLLPPDALPARSLAGGGLCAIRYETRLSTQT